MKLVLPSTCRLAVIAASLLAGCGGAPRAVKFSYQEPPVCEIPASVSRLAVAEFQGSPPGEDWGREVSQRLAEALERATLPHRVQIIGHEAAEAASRPAAGRAVIVDTPSAVAWGKAIGVDAVAYGMVSVTWPGSPATGRAATRPVRGQVEARSCPSARSGQPEHVEGCLVTVNLVIDEVRAGRTIASMSAAQRYPPQDGAPAAEPRAAAPSGEALAAELVAQCVDRLVGRLCPQTVWVNARLQVGRTRLVLDGNRLARAGRYPAALDYYLRAIALSPGDDGAVFNAGLMCEALGRLEEAEEFYDRSAVMRPGEHTDQARRRLDRRRTAGRK